MRRDSRSAEAEAYRRWYKTPRWQARRRAQLSREPLCSMCLRAKQLTPATIADHVIPHRGDTDLFWHGDLASLCKAHHDSAKQAEEHRGFSGEADDDGWPTDPRHPSNQPR